MYIWTQDSPRSQWTKVALEPTNSASTGQAAGEAGKFGDAVWRVSWSVSGNVLAVSSGMFASLLLVTFQADRVSTTVQVMAKSLCGRRT